MITKKYNLCDIKLEFYIPCPECGFMQPIRWGAPDASFGFKFKKEDPESIAYLCVDCASLFTQDQFLSVWENGKWMDEEGNWCNDDGIFFDKDGREIKPRDVGFFVWTGYSPMVQWSDIVRDFVSVKNDPQSLQGFVNLTLGEAWQPDQGKKIDTEMLAERKEHYGAEIPDGVVILTAGADVQDDRVEWGIKGWGAGEESWWIDYRVQYGDLSRADFWRTLAGEMKRAYKKVDGAMLEPRMLCIDSGGHFTDETYKFCRDVGRTFGIPTKGSSIMGKPVATFPMKPTKDGVYLTIVGTDTAKDLCYHRLLDENSDGIGNIHFPDAEWCDDVFFRMLTAERRRPKYDKLGALRFDWHCPSGRRNEAWDIEVLNLVAIRILQQKLNINLELLRESGKSMGSPSHEPQVVKRRRKVLSSGIDF